MPEHQSCDEICSCSHLTIFLMWLQIFRKLTNNSIRPMILQVIYVYCCFQILILLVAIGQQKKHGHVVLVQTHVEYLRVTVMETRTALETSHAELITVLVSSQKGLIAVMKVRKTCQLKMKLNTTMEINTEFWKQYSLQGSFIFFCIKGSWWREKFHRSNSTCKFNNENRVLYSLFINYQFLLFPTCFFGLILKKVSFKYILWKSELQRVKCLHL